MPKVFEGNAELDISKFLTSLQQMETAAAQSAQTVAAQFQQLDQAIQNALSGAQGHINALAQQITSIGAALAGANQQMQAGQQQLNQQAQQSNQQAQQHNANAAAARAAGLQALKADQQRALAASRQQSADEERILRERIAEQMQLLKSMGSQEAKQVEENYRQQAQAMRAAIEEQRKIQDTLFQAQAAAKNRQAQALTGGDTGKAAAAEQEYQKLVMAAQAAADKEASLQRQLTQVFNAETRARSDAAAKAQAELGENAAKANRSFLNGWGSALAQAVDDAARAIKQVEDKWNSIFRAGSQLASIGTQMTNFSQRLTQTGMALTENAGDFDFWNRRIVAAAKAANADLFQAFGGDQQQTIDAFGKRVMALGQELGALQPAEVAEGFYLFQAAAGTSIKSSEDLEASVKGLEAVMKAAIVSDTDYTVAIRGVTQAMAEFQLGTDQMAHATEVMLNLTQTSQSEFSDVLESFKMVGPQAARLGMSLEEVSAIISRLSDNGIRGSSAGRALSVALGSLLDPSDKASSALQQLFIDSKGLTGTWEEIVFKGGEFVGFLDTLNAKGEVVNKGFLHLIAEATAGMSEAQRQGYLGAIFTNNATRALIPLVGEYVDAMNAGAGATVNGKKRMEELQTEFQNATLQASLFGDQWQLVSESIKIRLGQATFAIRESLVRLGFIVAQTFLPMIEWVGKAVRAFLDWGEKHPAIAQAIVGLVAAFAGLMAVGGPLLIFLGTLLKTLATIPITLQVIRSSLGVVGVGLGGIGGAVSALIPPVLAFVAVLGLLYAAWKNNWLGMGQSLDGFFGRLKDELASLGDLLGGVMSLVEALLSGNAEKVKEALRTITIAFVESFAVLPQMLVDSLSGVGTALGDWINTTFSGLSEGMGVWGQNLMYSLGEGIMTAAQGVMDAVWGIAEGIAQFFRSFSPPKHGPLMGIFTWGKNLIGTFVEGMNAADLDAIENVAGRIGDALKLNIEAGGASADIYAETMELANAKVAEMVGIVKEGGRVNAEFFAPLKDGLGEWYDGVVQIALAYQDVFAVSSQLDVEREKLDLLKQQRKELDAQQEAREQAFDRALGQDDPNSVYSQFAQQEMVDPTTEEGKKKIEEMRRTLSKEDFDNWIGYQKAIWKQQDDIQDQALKTQEDAQQNAVDALEQQLKLVQAQYDYFVKMYEYAERMQKLQDEEDALKDKDKAAGNGLEATYGTPADLDAARRDIAGIVGADGAILDEGTLKSNRGGDDIGALGDAERQRDREQARIEALDKENRKRKADFETQLINATSDEERKRIKEQKDAWDAAYREQKANLQERLQFAKDIVDAAEQQADASLAGRIGDEEKAYQEDILKLLGDQTSEIADANTLREQAGSNDAAQVKAREQMREEERKLRDLQAANDQKKLEFEERLRQAKGDPEATRRIKEEQDAWEAAYKRAVEVQQARVEAARRAQQDLGDSEYTGAAGGGFGKGGFGGGFEPPKIPDATGEPEWLKKLKEEQQKQEQQSPVPPVPEKTRESYERAVGIFERMGRLWKDMTNSSISLETRMQALGIIIGKEVIGPFAQWFGSVTGLDRVFKAILPTLTELWNRFTGGKDIFAGLKDGWDKLIGSLGLGKLTWDGVKQAAIDLWTQIDSATGYSDNMAKLWNTILLPAINAVWAFVKTEVVPLLGSVFTTALDTLGFGLTMLGGIFERVLLPAINLVWLFIRDLLLPQLKLVWEIALPVLGAAVTTLGWVFSNVLWPAIKLVWQFFSENLLPILKLLAETGLLVVEAAVKGLTAAWETVLGPALKTFFGYINETALPKLKEFGAYLSETLKPYINDIKGAFDSVWSAVGNVIDRVGDLIQKARDLIGAWRDWLGLSGSKPKDPASPPSDPKVDGSNANGLGYVPFDGYISELHKGERVLTAAEAAVYNRMEAMGALGGLAALADGATARVQSATAATQQTTINNVSNVDNRKEVNVNVQHMDASNPDEGRTFLNKLAFLA